MLKPTTVAYYRSKVPLGEILLRCFFGSGNVVQAEAYWKIEVVDLEVGYFSQCAEHLAHFPMLRHLTLSQGKPFPMKRKKTPEQYTDSYRMGSKLTRILECTPLLETLSVGVPRGCGKPKQTRDPKLYCSFKFPPIEHLTKVTLLGDLTTRTLSSLANLSALDEIDLSGSSINDGGALAAGLSRTPVRLVRLEAGCRCTLAVLRRYRTLRRLVANVGFGFTDVRFALHYALFCNLVHSFPLVSTPLQCYVCTLLSFFAIFCISLTFVLHSNDL